MDRYKNKCCYNGNVWWFYISLLTNTLTAYHDWNDNLSYGYIADGRGDIEIILELKTKMVCIPIQMINEELLIFGGHCTAKAWLLAQKLSRTV